MNINIKLYAIGLGRNDSGNPDFYYNHVRDTWIRGFQLGCGFNSEEEAEKKDDELNLYGTEVIEGSAALKIW